jgi:hypothetical protein
MRNPKSQLIAAFVVALLLGSSCLLYADYPDNSDDLVFGASSPVTTALMIGGIVCVGIVVVMVISKNNKSKGTEKGESAAAPTGMSSILDDFREAARNGASMTPSFKPF